MHRIADYFGVPASFLLEVINGASENTTSTKMRDDASPFFDFPVFTEKELLLIEAYRQNPEIQQIIDLLLAKFADSDK